MARDPLNAMATAWAPALVLIGCLWTPARAADTANAPGEARATTGVERLSDWLLRQPQDLQHDRFGLQWHVPSERAAQTQLKQQLLNDIAHAPQLSTANREAFQAWIQALPVTGRVRVPVVDARWLQAHPSQDPVLEAGQIVRMPERPTRVAVVQQNGGVCTVRHQSGALVSDYVDACGNGQTNTADWAWVIQADGSVSRQAIHAWNAAPQSELAPGAIVWAPTRGAGWPDDFSDNLARFFATQSFNELISATRQRHAAQDLTQPFGEQSRDLPLSANDWGLIGLLQTPTARMAPAGALRFNFSRTYPYERYNVFSQPFDALEVGFRYTNVANRLYGPSIAGAQPYKDKSIDFKLRLLEETAWRPQVAVGITDVGGTGLFSSEYLVANKRLGNFDLSAGLGWGYLGASNNLGNPLGKLNAKFNTRSSWSGGSGGTLGVSNFFRGPTALFGGVQYHLPSDKWLLKAEYDGNDYQHEPQNNNRRQSLPVNFGLVYRQNPNIDWSLAVERGNALMLGLTLRTNVAQLSAPKLSDPPSPKALKQRPIKSPEWPVTALGVSEMSGWGVRGFAQKDRVLQVSLDNLNGAHWNDRIERMVAELHRLAPMTIDTFELTLTERGIPLTRKVVDRDQWVKAHTQLLPPSQTRSAISTLRPRLNHDTNATALWRRPSSVFSYGITPNWQQNIGGPDGFVMYQLGVSVPAQLRLAEDWWVSGAVNLRLIDNYENFKYTGPSKLPRVRTYMREYMVTSRLTMPNLQLTHMGQLTANSYYSLYGGYLESQYAGIGGEWLYRPWHSRLAFGVDINAVKQRNFDQGFGFDDAGTQTGYSVKTGHATIYWDTKWHDVQMKLSAGRYLAGDMGATLELSRTFDNGVSVGAWATKTNVSSAQFGEGSFDKGMFVKIPFDVMMTTRSGNQANLIYSPLTRDGGARLNRAYTLYGATQARSVSATGFEPVKTPMYP